MFNRYRTALMEAEGEGKTAPTPPVPPASAVPPTASTPPAPTAGEEFKAMSVEQFNARLAKERELATKAMLKETGFANLDEYKGFITKAKEAEEAKKSAEQKMQEKLAALEPLAPKLAAYEKDWSELLAIEESSIPEDKKSILDLAPPPEQVSARAKWIRNAKLKGLFNAAAPVVEDKKQPANTRAGIGTPPSPAPPPGQKRPVDMTPDEFRKYEQQKLAEHSASRR